MTSNTFENAHESPIELVDRFLQLCEDRQLELAAQLLHPEIVMVFPGKKVHHTLQEMVDGARGRYKWVKKNRTDFSIGRSSHLDQDVVVISRGTLYGEALDGKAFEGVRYIDFFILRENKIIEQHVWNDLADLGITEPSVID